VKQLRFDQFGAQDVLRVKEGASLRAGPDEAVVDVFAASVNPSDVANVAGRFARTTLPRTPGRDFAGVILQGPPEWVGIPVWGTGDTGFERDGSHAQQIVVPVRSLRRKPKALSFVQAASVGVTFAAAWLGIVRCTRLQAGETLVVIGASGGVGSAAVQIGHAIGARVIGIDIAEPHRDNAALTKAEWVIDSDDHGRTAVRELTGGLGAHVVLNAVGNDTFEPSLAMLAHLGRIAVMASPKRPRQEFNLADFYHNESQLFGVDTLAYDLVASAPILDEIGAGFERGAYAAPVVDSVVSLEDAPQAYQAVASGRRGRVVLAPSGPR
jgi:NADPH2:quinone reductase